MDENPPKENPQSGFNTIDLSQLQGFSFGTQWTQDKGGAQEKRDGADSHPRREDRRDRRAFRKPEGAPESPRDDRAGDVPRRSGPAGSMGAPQRREFSGERRGPDMRDNRGGPRSGPERGGYGPGRSSPQDRMPYDSPFYSVTFYPEDTSFSALVKTIRASCRTIELFEIARTVLGKPERFTVLLAPKDPSAPPVPQRQGQAPRGSGLRGSQPATESSAPSAQAGAEGAPKPESPVKPEVPIKPAFYISVPDGLPFESADAAVGHVLSRHLKLFFDVAEVEVDPPKGNYQVVNRCGITGELLGPPNYHRYSQIVQQHFASKGLRMPFEAYRARIETVREPELINQWLDKMKRITRYTWKNPAPPRSAPVSAPPANAADSQAATAPEPAAVPADAPPPPVEPAAPTFDSLDEAKAYLLAHSRDRVMRPSAHARFHGREVEGLPPGEIRRAVEGTLDRQRRFPLDTANALRGRLRREHFTIFKKGAKGISYVCAVKRKFRIPGQTFAESIGALIAYIEAHPMVRAGELVKKYLGVADAPEPSARAADGAAPAGDSANGSAVKIESTPAPAILLTQEQREKVARMQGDLLWLVREGYVTEFIDGSLYAAPPMVEARKKEVEGEDHDPENFPEPAPEPAAESAAESTPVASPGRLPEVADTSLPEPAPAPAVELPSETVAGTVPESAAGTVPSTEGHSAPVPEPPADPVTAT